MSFIKNIFISILEGLVSQKHEAWIKTTLTLYGSNIRVGRLEQEIS